MCPVSCGGADQTRTRTITTEPMHEGQACGTNSMETRQCNTDPCPGMCHSFLLWELQVVIFLFTTVDCVWSNWDTWTPCSVSCGGADQTRSRTITTMPMNMGQECGDNDMETRRCNENACPGNQLMNNLLVF